MPDFEENHDENFVMIELIDENNEILRFEILENFEFGGNAYVILAPLEELEGVEDEEEVAFVFKVRTVDGEDLYEDIDDEDEWAEIEAYVEEHIDLA